MDSLSLVLVYNLFNTAGIYSGYLVTHDVFLEINE